MLRVEPLPPWAAHLWLIPSESSWPSGRRCAFCRRSGSGNRCERCGVWVHGRCMRRWGFTATERALSRLLTEIGAISYQDGNPLFLCQGCRS